MFCSPKPSMIDDDDSPPNSYGKGAKNTSYSENDDLPLIQALESSSFSPAASPTVADDDHSKKKKKKVLTVDTLSLFASTRSNEHHDDVRSLQTPVGSRSSPTTLAQTPLANAMDVDDASLLEAFASVSYSPFAEMRAENKKLTKSPVIFEDKEDDEEVVEYDDSATTTSDMLQSGDDTINETFEVESTTTENMEVHMPTTSMVSSLDDLNHLMMSAECVEEYNAMKEAPSSTRSYFEDNECYVPVQVTRVLYASRGVEMNRNSKIRKALIEEELGQLIELAVQDKDMDEFEPEAVEALGIAAYRLAYQRKYHDAKTGEDVYIPSVAYTVMDGSLLELASQHYFGKSNEFLVTYAGAMGSAIMQQKQHYQEYNSEERENHHDWDAQELNISNVSASMSESPMNQQPLTPINSDQIMRLVWGVSPRASLMKDSTKRFTFPSETVEVDVPKASRSGGRKMIIMTLLILALTGAALFQTVHPSQLSGPMTATMMVPNEEIEQATPASLEQPKPSLFAQLPGKKKSPKEDLTEAWKIASSFWKQRFSYSKEQVIKTWKGALSFFDQQVLADLEVHMFEETHEQLSSLNKFRGTKTTMPNLLFGKETKQLAFTSVEDFQQAIAANRGNAQKKLEANKDESPVSDSMMKIFAAESFSWNDN